MKLNETTIPLTSILKVKNLPKLLVVILAITIICLLFPNHGFLNYEFKIGQDWSYNDIIAEESFEVDLILPMHPGSDSLTSSTMFFNSGDLIVSRGQEINDKLDQTLDQYFEYMSKRREMKTTTNSIFYFLGYFILTALILCALILYALKFFLNDFNSITGIVFLVIWPIVFCVISYFVNTASAGLSPYLIPFCLVPIVVLNFHDGKMALVIHLVVVLLSSFISQQGYEFIFLQILAGIVTVLIVKETRYWNKFFISVLTIYGTYILGHLGLALINSGTLVSSEYNGFVWISISSLLLLIAYPFIPIVEKVFGLTSNITLAELTDMNKPLLKELSIKAPGTLQHSMQVANLCESAADKIGANSLLVKTAALYHDIGKMAHPFYFIENSKGENLHENISNFESAKIIIDHVVAGEQMAKKAKLPQILIDFIKTHHGTTKVEYFFRNQKQQNPDKEFDASLFEYPGPKPTTKEQTILMLADTIEAACKSLKNPNGQEIDALVDKLVDYKIDQGQLSESMLSFNELNECVNVFKSLLRSIYHVRVEYPNT